MWLDSGDLGPQEDNGETQLSARAISGRLAQTQGYDPISQRLNSDKMQMTFSRRQGTIHFLGSSHRHAMDLAFPSQSPCPLQDVTPSQNEATASHDINLSIQDILRRLICCIHPLREHLAPSFFLQIWLHAPGVPDLAFPRGRPLNFIRTCMA